MTRNIMQYLIQRIIQSLEAVVYSGNEYDVAMYDDDSFLYE